MRPSYHSLKSYPEDLYDQLKDGANHIVCLGQNQTKTFIMLAAIRHHAHLLHSEYGSYATIIVEPNKDHADERQRMLSDHTEFRVVNLFNQPESSEDNNSSGQIFILSMHDIFSSRFETKCVNLVLLDFAHLLLLQNVQLVKDVVKRFQGVQILSLMCSLVHNNHEFSPIKTVQIIHRLESIFDAKCETSSDLRSISRRALESTMEVIEFNPAQLVTCDWQLLADSMFRNFCELMLDKRLDYNEPLIKPETGLTHASGSVPSLSLKKQLVLVRSCLSDILYALHCLGLWCTKKTVQLYLTEFSRLLQNVPHVSDLIASASTILNCFYGRLDELVNHFNLANKDDIFLQGSTDQLRALLDSLKKFENIGNISGYLCMVHVRRRVIAKVIALWLEKISETHKTYSFIKPNYIVGSTRKHRNRMAVDNFDLHHEAAVRDFRYGNCNVLITAAAVNDRCTGMPRCHLVISFDLPARFSDFIQAKGNCRYDNSRYIIMLNRFLDVDSEERLLSFVNMERLLNNMDRKADTEIKESAIMELFEAKYEPYPKKQSISSATIKRSIMIINRYCTKLPSDLFTKLCPEWRIRNISSDDGKTMYQCEMRLPINSPVRQTIVGPPAPDKSIAIKLAAFTACKILHKAGELDDNMLPITKEAMKHKKPPQGPKPTLKRSQKGQSIGSTKHRQYYKKRIAEVFSGPLVVEGIICYLYKFKMVLTCPLPDEQNRRGRRIIDPSETNRNYAIVSANQLPKICAFPVFTRSGEVMISVELIGQKFTLTSSQVRDLRVFHEYTISKVLRLDKYPTVYDPENSPFKILLAPVIDEEAGGTKIDWTFVDKIVESDRDSCIPSSDERKSFKFNHDDYIDAVVIPWYRQTDSQQFAYYVAEICTDLSPKSAFPDEESGYKTFVEYYEKKYELQIYNKDQPVLDVDHTSARLNLLTPRYVNRKGITLPSSTAKTRRESRESLVQKQLLIPELCSIHPFPASFWRKAVCLPCIFYRLNSLFLAEALRREVAKDTRIGFIEPPEDFVWPPLNFGWSLKDVVISNQATEDEIVAQTKKPPKAERSDRSGSKSVKKPKVVEESKLAQPIPSESDFVIDHFDPSKYDIPDIPLDAPQNDWMNIKLISSSSTNNSVQRGWDEPIEQHDLYLEHTNEVSWSDCEMEFEGELTERVGQMRCGSPSAFEPGKGEVLDLDNTQTYPCPPANSSKNVKFNNVYEDSFDESGKETSHLNSDVVLNSEASWSLSDDDYIDTGNSEDDIPYDEWKDSKAENRPLVRELFLPIYRVSKGPSASDFESLHIVLKDGINSDVTELESYIITKLETRKTFSEPTQSLVGIMDQIFEYRVVISDEDIESARRNWYKLEKSLSQLVETTFSTSPDLFRDNGIELTMVDDSFTEYSLEFQPTFGELLPNRDTDRVYPSEDWKEITFDSTRKDILSVGPRPSVILQALTMSNASDGINLERLETVGDSFLKYSVTAYLYCMNPTLHEGKLSYLRSTEISNANLYKLGRDKRLGELMSATKFEPKDNWLPPGYTVAVNDPKGRDENNKKREIDKALAEVPYDLLLQHSIPDKSIADSVEALIGAYLTSSGPRAALLFMRWLGLQVIPESYDIESDLSQPASSETIWRWLDTPPSPLICIQPSFDDGVGLEESSTSVDELKSKATEELNRLYYANNLDQFEKEIGYTFKDKAYLVQALTHNSFYENHVTGCYQRIEFLGDALLDFLITRYLFEDPRLHSPGTLTDLRSALVNNTFFASLAVKYKFHKYLKYISDELFQIIDAFLKKFHYNNKDTISKSYTLLICEGESECAEDTEVPKALGDVFESVAGAIYLDSGMSLDQVWKVYFQIMKPEIEYFSSNVPKSPIRELLESMPQKVRFSPSEMAPDRMHRVIAEVFGLGRFTGVGRNKHSAKSTAAKRALRMLALKKKEIKESGDEPKTERSI